MTRNYKTQVTVQKAVLFFTINVLAISNINLESTTTIQVNTINNINHYDY